MLRRLMLQLFGSQRNPRRGRWLEPTSAPSCHSPSPEHKFARSEHATVVNAGLDRAEPAAGIAKLYLAGLTRNPACQADGVYRFGIDLLRGILIEARQLVPQQLAGDWKLF